MEIRFPFPFLSVLCLFVIPLTLNAQQSRIAKDISHHDPAFSTLKAVSPLLQSTSRDEAVANAQALLPDALFYQVDQATIENILNHPSDILLLEIPFEGNASLTLKLKRADVFSSTFKVITANGEDENYSRSQFYWGVVEGHEPSLVSIAFQEHSISGFIQLEDEHLTIGRLENDHTNTHILYKTNKLPDTDGLSCFTTDEHRIGRSEFETGGARDASNCIRMYVQVDYDMYLNKGGVQQAADYVTGAFSQVALLYANESINLVINELFVWNIPDPFTGPTTSNYLNQFRTYLNGNFNGDLAHLVGLNGGGGIAYLDVLCNPLYGVGYSAVNTTYEDVPDYSWTVMVLAHEIGHNIASPHTHACAWNGNNTAIDGCGPAAGYSEGCNGPVPSAGTIMSYCHLVSSIDLNLGFGPQPGDLLRSSAYNASCLTSCGPPAQNDAGITAIDRPIAFPCESFTLPEVTLKNFGAATLNSVTIEYQVDNGAVQNYIWLGVLSPNQTTNVLLPLINYAAGAHTFEVNTVNPNGQADENTSNDAASKSFTYHVDWCVCTSSTGNISPNPLNHSGTGSSTATINLGAGSKRPQFTISNLNAKTNGPANSRFNERVVVWYNDAYGNYKVYGTFLGSQQSTVNVNIQNMVNDLGITLSNALNNSYSGTLSVSFGTVTYCGPEGGPCDDDDNDGVCNDEDVCADFDDNLIGTACNDGDPCTLNDEYTTNCLCEGTPDPGCGCTTETDHFSPNPLTHSGTGSSFSVAALGAGNSDAVFTINGLDARISGNPNNRYIEQVTVRYVNSSNQTVTYGVFRGDQVSSVNVTINGIVQSVSVTLQDIYDGNSSTQMSVSMTAVTSCSSGGLVNVDPGKELQVYPNPTQHELFIKLPAFTKKATIEIYNTLGMMIAVKEYENVAIARFALSGLIAGSEQLIFVSVKADGKDVGVRRVMVVK